MDQCIFDSLFFFKGLPKKHGMEFSEIKYYLTIFFKAFEAEWKKWNDDWEAEKKAKSEAAPKVP